MKAILMAGGEGSRLRPLTSHRPKPLVPVGNRPIMEHILLLLKKHGITEVIVTAHYLSDEIEGYFDTGEDFGMKLTYCIEDSPLGTAGSVKNAEHHLTPGEPFLILSGDALTDCDLSSAIEFHGAHDALATLVLCRVPNPLEYGVVITDSEQRIQRFLEKPSWSEVFSDTVNTGIYILEYEVLEQMEPHQNYDWSKDIFPQLLHSKKGLYGYVMNGYWCDIGNLDQYREANEMLLDHRSISIPMGTELCENIWIGPHCILDEEAVLIPPVVLGRGCKVKKHARIGPYTIIGDNALIEEGALVERSIIWDSPYIGPNVKISGAVIGTRVTLKRDVTIHDEAVIGDRCLVDVGAIIKPKVKLWGDKIIERGATVTMSLIWGNKWRGNLFRQLGVAGLSNIEITPDFATRIGSAFGSVLPEQAKIVTSRDSSRSSRMIKRAVIASLLSVGCDVIDLRNAPSPILRHFIRNSNAYGGINVRKLPGNNRVTLIEMFDDKGNYISKGLQRKVETTFFREDFHRIDPDDLGTIEFASRAVEEYQVDYFKLIHTYKGHGRLRIICDYGYSSISGFFPTMLGKIGVESISLNGYNDAKLAPRTPQEIQNHLSSLSQIVSILGYDIGVLFIDEGERMILVDNLGRILKENDLAVIFGLMTAKAHPDSTIAIDATIPRKIEHLLVEKGLKIIRARSDINESFFQELQTPILYAADHNGGFIYPQVHSGMDAMLALGNLINMLQTAAIPLSDIADEIPDYYVQYEKIHCTWENKGLVMRKLAEIYQMNEGTELEEGVKIQQAEGWLLILPDQVEPILHLYAESHSQKQSEALVHEFLQKIHELMSSSWI